jgi:hypothetical protein
MPRTLITTRALDVAKIAALVALTTAQSGGQCQLSQAFNDLIRDKFNGVKVEGNRNDVRVCRLSFLDGVTKSGILGEKATKLDEAVEDGMSQAAAANPRLKLNPAGHCPPNTPANVEKFAAIVSDPNLTPQERFEKASNELMGPTGTDILITGLVYEQPDQIQVRPMAVSRPDKKIQAKNLEPFSAKPGDSKSLFDRMNGQLVLTPAGREQVSKAVQDLLR